ncbi:MAG TPA: hypothetical protein VFE42_33235 [Chloroflexota bacterium]|nr:hypothetical protein [Chloroflexota bacterium]
MVRNRPGAAARYREGAAESAEVSDGVLFLGAALCSALSGVLVWRVQGVR